MTSAGDFHGGPVVENPRCNEGTRVQSLVRELGFHVPQLQSPLDRMKIRVPPLRCEAVQLLNQKFFLNYLRGVTSIKLQRIQGVHIILERAHTVYDNIINNILKGHQILKDSINTTVNKQTVIHSEKQKQKNAEKEQ